MSDKNKSLEESQISPLQALKGRIKREPMLAEAASSFLLLRDRSLGVMMGS